MKNFKEPLKLAKKVRKPKQDFKKRYSKGKARFQIKQSVNKTRHY